MAKSCVVTRKGVTSFRLLRHRRNDPKAFLYAFDLLGLNGADLRKEPIEVRKGDPGQHPAQEGAPE